VWVCPLADDEVIVTAPVPSRIVANWVALSVIVCVWAGPVLAGPVV